MKKETKNTIKQNKLKIKIKYKIKRFFFDLGLFFNFHNKIYYSLPVEFLSKSTVSSTSGFLSFIKFI